MNVYRAGIADVYLKKQMIEHMVDELASLAAPSDPKKKN